MRLIRETVECFSSSIHYHHIKGLQYDNSGVQLRELTCPLPEEEYLGRPESKAETKNGDPREIGDLWHLQHGKS